jgi:sodium-dependent phosphate cotransporter
LRRRRSPGPNEFFALQIALVHLLYNVFGVLLFMALPLLRQLPVLSSEWLGGLVEGNRAWALGYVAAIFFLLPGVVFAIELLYLDREPVHICAADDLRCLAEDAERVDMRIE